MKKLLLLLFTMLTMSGISNAQCFMTNSNVGNTCGPTCNGVIWFQFNTPNLPVQLYINGGVPITVTSGFVMDNLCPGVYAFLAVDANGDTCVGNAVVIINQVPGPTVTLSTTNATCPTCNDGVIVANVTGGSAPYTYTWSNGSTTQNQQNLSPGTYTLIVTDANGCSTQVVFTIGVGNNGFFSLEGEVYIDINSNGIKDVGEPPAVNQSISIQPIGATALTNSLGQHVAVVNPGVYDVSYVPVPGWNLTSTPATYNADATTASVTGLDFGVYPDSTAGNAFVTLTSGFPRCFWTVPYYISVYNTGFTTLDGSVNFTFDPAMTYVSSNVTPFSQVGNQVSYTFTQLYPGQSLTIIVQLTEPAGGTAISNTVSINAGDAFGNQFAKNASLLQTVSCSYDPNDKQVFPAGIGALNYVAMDEWLTYQIRFQNTGNDTAFKVVILDTLDTNLDLSTFSVIGSSHNVTTAITAAREVSFTFENILLPDSNVNEPGSHGYVLYRIKGLQSNPDPTSVNNTAYIYFDLNTPVITNTTLTTFSDNFLGIADHSGDLNNFIVFPNPTNTKAQIKYVGQDNQQYYLELLDVAGRTVRTSALMNDGNYTIDKNDLKPGSYLVKISGDTVTYLRLVIY